MFGLPFTLRFSLKPLEPPKLNLNSAAFGFNFKGLGEPGASTAVAFGVPPGTNSAALTLGVHSFAVALSFLAILIGQING